MENKKILKIILISIFLIILIDQVSKILINKFMPEETIILQNVLAIEKKAKEEAMFKFNKQNISDIILGVIALLIIIRFMIVQKERLKIVTTIYLSMMIAGGISNLIDIIFKGAVFDFFKVGKFPTFNIASLCIIIGWILFVVDFIKNSRNISKEE